MEAVRDNMNLIFGALLFVVLSSTSCKKCSTCDDIPNNVMQLQGEWEWVFTQRQFFTGNGDLFNDTINQEQTNAMVFLTITNDGCFHFTVEDSEHFACMDVYYVDHEEDSVPTPVCQEQVAMNLEGKNISTHFLVQVKGLDCEQMNSLEGTIVPFNSQTSYLSPPPHPIPGMELNGYSNHFVRVQ